MATPAAVLAIVVEAQTGKARAELQRFDRLHAKDKVINVRLELDKSSVAAMRASQALLTKESSRMGDVFNRSNLSIGQTTGLLAASIPVAFDLAGALGALTASLGAATAGLGALAVGIGGVMTVGFGGIAAIAAPAISSLKDLMTAQEAADKAKVTGSGSAARASVASAQQIIAAEQQLQTAQQSAELAQESLTQARQDAVRQLQDMRRAAMGAAANEESAQISLDRARQNLRQVMRDEAAGALDVREAENEVVLARQSLRDVTIQGNRAQKDYNAAQKGGINQMAGVVSAQQSLDSATQGVADAMRNLANQQKEANMAAGAGATSLAALALAAKKAGPAAVKFAQHIKEMGQRWRGLTREGKNDFFGMLDDGLGRLNKKIPMLAESANKSMKALRGGFNTFLKTATGPEFDHFVDVMTNTFAKSIGPVSKAFGNIAKVLQRIAVAVAPDLVKMAKDFRGMTQGWLDSTRNAGKLRETIHGLVGQTRAWWDLLVAAKDLIVAVLVPGMGEGKKAVQDMTGQLKEWTRWANSHPKDIRDFMKEGLETTKKLAEALLSFLPTLFEVSKAMRPIARFALGAVKALNSIKIGDWSLLSGIIAAIVAKKIINGFLAIKTAIIGMRTAIFGAAAAETALGAATARTTAAMVAQQAVMARGLMIGTGAGARRVGGVSGGGVLLPPGTSGGGIAGGVGRGKATGKLAGLGKGIGGLLGLGAGGSAIASVAAPLAAIAVAMKGIDETGLLDSGGPVSKTKLGALLGIGDKSLGEKIDEIVKSLNRVKAADQALKGSFSTGNVRRLEMALEKAGEAGADTGERLATLRASMQYLATRVIGGSKAIKGLDRVLKGLSTMPAQEAIDGLRKKYGGLVTAGHEMSKKQRVAFMNMMRVARENGDITQRQLERVTDAFDKNSSKWARMMRRAANATGESTKSMARATRGMTVRVSKDYEGMVEVTGGGLQLLTSNTRKALNSVGMGKAIKRWSLAKGKGQIPAGAKGYRRGGPIGGAGEGDKVPAMLEPGEFVVNKKATKAARPMLERLNQEVPRFQAGGVVQHFAKGGMAAMIAEANKFERRGFPYTWGGGHSDFGIQPVDCSGAVSQVLHAAGLLNAPMVSGDLAHWGKAGKGPLTVYANPEHTLMSLAGRFFGTSSSNPGGGAGWIGGGFDQGYLGGFAARTMDAVGGVVGKIKRVILDGPDNALKDIGQGNLDTHWKALNKFVEKKMPGGGFGGGQTLKDFSKGPGKIVGASVYGFGEPGTGTVGASGVSLPGKPAFAELDMGTALGHLPFGKKVGIEVGGKKAVGIKLDIGAGGGAVGGHHRAIDFWRDLAEKLGLSGSFLGLAKVRGLQKGGMVAAPYVGAFQQGGDVAKTGLGLLHEGERVVPKMAQGGFVAGRGDRPDAQGGGRRGDDRRGGGLGVERIQRIRERLGKQLGQVVPKLDEEIDIAERLAGLTTSPGGSEMAKSEIDKQLRLQRGLLRILRNTLNIAKRGMRMVQRVMKRIEDGIKELQRKIAREQKQMEQQVKRLTKFIESERKKDKPDQKKIEKAQEKLRDVKARHARPLERWQEQLGKYNKAAPRLPEMRSGFREAIVELSGLTGRGGRIFDTSLSVKELQASKVPQPIGIEELLSFAEAMRFGAFNRQLGTAGNIPTFAQGGVHRGGLALVGEKGPEVVQMPPAQVFPTGTAPTVAPPVVEVEIKIAEGMGWLRKFIDVEVTSRDRRERGNWRRDRVAR